MRSIAFFAIALAIFVPFNWIAWMGLTRIHPRRRRWVLAAIVLGNAMWPFFAILNARTDFSRFIRATLGPVWFGWQSFAILYTVLLALIAIAWLPFRRRNYTAFAHAPSKVFLWIVIVGSIAGYYDAIVPIRIEHVPVTIANLPPALDGTRIALLGDLHTGLFTRESRLRQFFKTAQAQKPDVVILAGDLIDDDTYFVPKLLRGAAALDPSIPLLAVLGNHEMYGAPFEVIDKLRGSRIHLLVNEGAAIAKGERTSRPLGRATERLPPRMSGRDVRSPSLWIAGISDFAARDPRLEPDFDRALAGKPTAAIPIVVAHQPKAFDAARARHIPLTLVAHTHGGQFGFRPLRWSLAGLFLRYHMGLSTASATRSST
ncbi:MAG TPA: metallophosphoesterase [Thermoanaerobaculia bacterium]|nr:metallophosphoesterase [Thermoanaerobaculia bacterium]